MKKKDPAAAAATPAQSGLSSQTSVRVVGGENPTPATVIPAPVTAPAPAATDSGKKEGFFARTLGKVFPSKKAAPAPPLPGAAASPGPTPESRYTVTVKTEGGEERVITPTVTTPPAAAITPAPVVASPQPNLLVPTEGFLARTWHRVFPRKEAPPAALTPAWIGIIKLVNPAANYALVDSQPYQAVEPGTVLNAVGNETETGSLRVSTDRNPPFFIADIISGRPAVGDRVYSPQP